MPASPNDAVAGGAVATLPSRADALRQVADWLDEHPELGRAFARVGITAAERGDLERLAAALGDGAKEHDTSTHVHIEGDVAGVGIYALLPIAKLTGRPEYQPILPLADTEGGES